MKITIKDQEIELFYTYRMHIIYENIVGESLVHDFQKLTDAKKAAALFYSCIIASAKKQKIEVNLDFDGYMDWLDENGGYVLINKFLYFLASKLNEKYDAMKEEQEQEDDLPKSTKKVKN